MLFYLPDITGVSKATMALATEFNTAGFTVLVLDYFNGGNGTYPQGLWSIANSTARVRMAVADARDRWPNQPFSAFGACWGGGTMMGLTSGNMNSSFDVVTVAHAAQVTVAQFQQVVVPLFAAMPQNDNGFNTQAAAFLGTVTCAGCRGHEVMFKVYPGVSHGFTVTVNESDANAVKQKAAALDDIVRFLYTHVVSLSSAAPSTSAPALTSSSSRPLAAAGVNMTLGGMNTYQAGSGDRIVLLLEDAGGFRQALWSLADQYAQAGYHVYLPDYFSGGTNSGWNVDNSTARMRLAVLELRQLYPTALIFASGYCWGGYVGLALASGPNRVDAVVVAHASLVTVAVWDATVAPVLAVMPQNDNSFNNLVPSLMPSLICTPLGPNCLGTREATFKVYPGVGHGFAVTVNMSDPNAVAQKQASFDDTTNFFYSHSSLTPALPTLPTAPSSTGGMILPSSSASDMSMSSSSSAAGSGFTTIRLGDMRAYQAGSAGPILLYLPDINGVGAAAFALASQYAGAGFQVYVLDYFDGGRGVAPWSLDNSTARTRLAIADIRSQFPDTLVFSTGYCWGGYVGVSVASGDASVMVDVSVVAHAAAVTVAMYNQAVSPLLAEMPQYDNGFNNNAGAFMGTITCAGCRGHVAMFKVYPGVNHGFAVTVNTSDPNAVKQKTAAFNDAVAFFQLQAQALLSSRLPTPAPRLQPAGTNVTLAGMNTYNTGSGDRILLYMMDINGWGSPATTLADQYAGYGFNVYMPDYCGGASCRQTGVGADVAATRSQAAVAALRQLYPLSRIYSTGYCLGGGAALRFSNGLPSPDVVAVAHASAVSAALFVNLSAPLLAVMPQNDNGFNSQVPLYMGTLTCSYSNCSREASFKVYPGVGHGFAVTVNTSDPNAVMQKEQAFLDTVNFFNQHR